MPSESNKDSTVVNRYTGSSSDAGANAHTGIKRSIGEVTSRDSESTSVHTRYQTPSLIDPGQSPTSTQLLSAGDATTAMAQQNAVFSAPAPFTGLSLDDLQSQHEILNGIAFTPQWRDSTPAAIAKLRRLLPPNPPPAYQLLTWACDQFAAFTRSGSCGDSTALMDVLDALQTLIQDAHRQPASSPHLEDTSSPSPKRQRPNSASATRAPQADALPEPPPDNTASQLESYLRALEDIPADAKDWTEKADPITKKILVAVKHDERIDPQHHVRDACLVFDMLGSQIVGNDLIHELRKALEDHGETRSIAHADRPGIAPSTMSTEPKEAAATTGSGELVFKSALEAAIYDVLRLNPTLTTNDLKKHPEISNFNDGVIPPAARSVRSRLAFGLPIEKFVQILKRVAKSSDTKGFAYNLARKERLGLSVDLFKDLKNALRRYQFDHHGNLPANEADAVSLVKHLPRNTTTAVIWLAATCRDPSCLSREQALIRWNELAPLDEATQLKDAQAALQPVGDRTTSGRPLTVEAAIYQSPWLSQSKLKALLPELDSHGIRKGTLVRQQIAYSLPDIEMIVSVIRAANFAQNADSFQKQLGKLGIAMNKTAFPDWKIALQIYKQTHGNQTPSSAMDLKQFVKCIQPSTTASAVYIAAAVHGRYCESLADATAYWQECEPDKFVPFKDRPLPQSLHHDPFAASRPGTRLRES